ncbi:putative zinc-binding metallopeptidase [Fulvivirgaceae bacterium PWU5]|uniref:Zinc-binding metallopeptidase n=1 Tax=Dawidia cretensis TaxID=2782350 RepID=A0AAP2E476_9BACT|nr:putative zinc-binding metallopeptidase [Dawidia cretensis]MBT1711879.1 putative zinc-binding metallopeptidase [Dawidia cretensis]
MTDFMYMRYTKFILPMIVALLTAVSCNDPYNDQLREPELVDGDPSDKTALDHWLFDTFTGPYNIEVKYKWDASESDIYKTLVPPRENKVQEVMDVVDQVWIEPFVDIAGANFIKKLCPKQFVLVGSARYNFDGTITLGTAEGGRKVVLYVINDFVKTDAFEVKQMMHTIEHEFTHILNQNVSFQPEFKVVTPGAYTAAWNTVPLADARAAGFITSYAMASPDEDFAEMTSMMLIEGRDAYENILSCETTAASYEALRRKEKLVVEYFQKAFKIDFYELQTKVQAAITAIAPDNGNPGGEQPPALLDVWGYGKQYGTFTVDLMTMIESAEITNRYAVDNDILHRYNLALDYNFRLTFLEANQIMLTLYYYTTDSEVREYKTANFVYELHEDPVDDAIGEYSLGQPAMDDAARELVEKYGAVWIPGYFVGPCFFDWATTCSGYRYAALYPVYAPNSYCLGVLKP